MPLAPKTKQGLDGAMLPPAASSSSLRVERASPYIAADELNVPRRPPWAALGWTAAGALTAVGLCMLYALHWLAGWNAISLDKRLAILAFILMALAVIHFPTVWAWLTGPRFFALGLSGVSLGPRTLGYRDIACFRHNYSKHLTDIVPREGERIRLHWAIWDRHEQWIAMLADQTSERLLADAWQRLGRGEELNFGKQLRLSLQTITIKGRPTSVRDIVFVNTLSGSNGGTDYRSLRIGTLEKTTEINLSSVSNPHIFFELMQTLVSGKQP